MPRRTNDQISHRYAVVAELYLQGISVAEIACRVGVTQRQINYDLKKLRVSWCSTAWADTGQIIQREIARLDDIEQKAWIAYESSKCPSRREKKRFIHIDNTQPTIIETVIVEEQRVADPIFLNIILKCIDKRCKLLNLYSTHGTEAVLPEDSLVNVSNTSNVISNQIGTYSREQLAAIQQLASIINPKK